MPIDNPSISMQHGEVGAVQFCPPAASAQNETTPLPSPPPPLRGSSRPVGDIFIWCVQNRALRVPGGSLVGMVGTLGSSHRRHEVEAGYFAGRTERRSGCDMHTYICSLVGMWPEGGTPQRVSRYLCMSISYVCPYHMYLAM